MVEKSATTTENGPHPPSNKIHFASVQPVAVAELPTRFGDFRVIAFTGDPNGKEHLALVRGDVRGGIARHGPGAFRVPDG